MKEAAGPGYEWRHQIDPGVSELGRHLQSAHLLVVPENGIIHCQKEKAVAVVVGECKERR